jgi:ATP synthase protein I
MTSPDSSEPTPPTASGTPHATSATTAQVLEASRAMRGGLWTAVVVAVLAAVVAGLLAGTTGVVAAVVGAVVVIGVCSLGPLVMRWTAAADPMVVMAAALVSMMAKLGLLLVVFLVLQALGVVDTRIAALALGPTAIAFIAGEVIAFARLRTPTIAV